MKIAILGAECSGKTTLAKRLATELTHQGFSACCVDEALRKWCDTQQRTPHAKEQFEIARLQIGHVHSAPACDYLIADTTALMTAIYSDVLFNDVSLYSLALEDQQQFDWVCVMGLDLPWIADGIQRDGVTMQAKVDAQLRHILQSQGIAFSVIYGTGDERLANALAAMAKAQRLAPVTIARDTPWQWVCDTCSDAQCEHRTFSALLDAKPTP